VEEDREDSSLSVGLHFGQLLIYLIMPASVLLATVIFGGEDQRTMAMIVAGALPCFLNLALMITSYSRRNDPEVVDPDDISCFSGAGFRFLFPPKQSVLEIVLCTFLTLAYGAAMTYAFHPSTMSLFYETD
jgi:hypothetical protein